MVRSVISVGGWVVMAWSGKSCLGPTEISTNVFLVHFFFNFFIFSEISIHFVASVKI